MADPDRLKQEYEQQGFVVVENVFAPAQIAELQRVTDALVEQARAHPQSDDRYDLEPDHAPECPRVQRVKVPHTQHPAFARAVRDPNLLQVLRVLLGDNVRFRNSKLNIKAARGGAAVDWHQDWAFYPHTNPDLLAVGIMLDDIGDDNAPLMVVPGSHRGRTLNHHYRGVFSGSVDVLEERIDVSSAHRITGRAGTASFHHVKALHGSAPNHSGRQRRLLLLEYAAADAWPLIDFEVYGDFAEFEGKLVLGSGTLKPRIVDEDIIMPYPRPPNPDSIYRIQAYRKA